MFSGCIPSITGRYHRSTVSAHLFGIVVAPAGSGKGAAKFALLLIMALHELKKARAEAAGDTYSSDQSQRPWGLYVPANTSAAMFLLQLEENGGELMLFETEIDALVTSISQEWGDVSYILRCAFHNEPISYARKQDRINVQIKRPKIALVLTGTIEQLLKLIPSTENGLFSRILFYSFMQEVSWQSPKPCLECENPEDYFERKGEEVKQMALFLEAYPAEFTFTDGQWEDFNAYFDEALDSTHASHGEESNASTFRMGLIMFRIAMVLSAMRKWENRDEGRKLVCTDEDYNTAKTLSDIYFKHSLTMLEVIPNSNVHEHLDKFGKFYLHLPDSFTKAKAIEIGKTFNWSERTIARRLDEFIEQGKLQRQEHGNYTKTQGM